jgi:hypothetical protein
MKIFYSQLVLITLFAALWAAPAHADVDQRCLSLCVSDGGSGNSCLQKCTYNDPLAKPRTNAIPNPSANGSADPHNVLEAPKPMGGEILMPTHKAKQTTHSKDYTCINQCLQQGGQYDLCSKTCTRADCPPGDSRCQDLLGATTSAFPSSAGGNTPH